MAMQRLADQDSLCPPFCTRAHRKRLYFLLMSLSQGYKARERWSYMVQKPLGKQVYSNHIWTYLASNTLSFHALNASRVVTSWSEL